MVSYGDQPEQADGAADYLTPLIQGMVQGMAISSAEYVSMDEYLAQLDAASLAFHESGNIQHLQEYHGEFHDTGEVEDQYPPSREQAEFAGSSTGAHPTITTTRTGYSVAAYEYHTQEAPIAIMEMRR